MQQTESQTILPVPKARDTTIDIAKGIGIALVVLGHSVPPEQLFKFVNLFHMPLFFFLSGCFFREAYADAKLSMLKKRVVGLYVPFLQAGLLFILLHNSFIWLGLYDPAGTYGPQVKVYAMSDYISSLLKLLVFRLSEPLLGPLWFLPTLFNVNVMFLFFIFVAKRIKMNVVVAVIVLSWCVHVVGYQMSDHSVLVPRFFPAFFTLSLISVLFYAMGFLYYKYKKRIRPHWIVALLTGLALFMFVLWGAKIEYVSRDFGNIFYLFSSSCAGIYLTLYLSTLRWGGFISRYLQMCGEKTLPILVFHVISFKLSGFWRMSYTPDCLTRPWHHSRQSVAVHGIGSFILSLD